MRAASSESLFMVRSCICFAEWLPCLHGARSSNARLRPNTAGRETSRVGGRERCRCDQCFRGRPVADSRLPWIELSLQNAYFQKRSLVTKRSASVRRAAPALFASHLVDRKERTLLSWSRRPASQPVGVVLCSWLLRSLAIFVVAVV